MTKQYYYESNRKARNDPSTTTPHEKKVEKYLKSRGIKYIKEYERMCCSKQYFLDFYLIKEQIGIEVDGDTSHYTLKGRKKDRRKASLIMKYHGIPIIHIKNSEVDAGDFSKIDNPQIQLIKHEYKIKPKKAKKKMDWKVLYKRKKEFLAKKKCSI